MRRLVVGAGLALAVVVAWAAPALAHASLQSTSPAAGQRLDGPPGVVELAFTEPVEVSVGAVKIYDSAGTQLQTGAPYRPGGDAAVAVELPDLADGTYVVTWRVVSTDSHPIHGAFTFGVGAAGAGQSGDAAGDALARRLVAGGGGDPVVGVLFGLARLVAFASLLTLVGGAVLVVVLWPEGRALRRTRTLLWTALGALAVATLAGIGLEGAYGAGLGLSTAVDPSTFATALDTRFGVVSFGRLGLLVGAAAWLWAALRRRPGQARPQARGTTLGSGPLLLGAALGAGLLATPGLAGHASTGDLAWLARSADLVHLAAAACWLGGLAVLAACALPQGDAHVLGRVVPRFSRLAMASVGLLVVTGTFQSWRQVGSLDALSGTTYGRLLLAKLALFVGLVGLAAVSRRWVQRRYGIVDAAPAGRATPALSGGPGAAAAVDGRNTISNFRRSVGAEVAVAVAVLAVTALLVNATPARAALAKPFSAEMTTPKLLIDVTVDPAKAGPMAVHLYLFTPEGAARDVEELTAELSLASPAIGPLELPLEPAGPGHYTVSGFDLPIAGRWQLEVTARLSDIEQVTTRVTVPVR